MNQKQLDILGHTHQLFMEKGYVDTSVQDILERSGISKGTFYKYFHLKANCFSHYFRLCKNHLFYKEKK